MRALALAIILVPIAIIIYGFIRSIILLAPILIASAIAGYMLYKLHKHTSD